MADIQTPSTARKPEDFTLTNRNSFKNGINLFGKDVISATKIGIIHSVPITLYDNTVFSIVSDKTINEDDIFEDDKSTSLTVVLKNMQYISKGIRCDVEIRGSIAYVNSSVNYEILDGNYVSTFDSGLYSAGVFVTKNRIYHIRSSGCRVLDLSGSLVFEFGSSGTGDGQFTNPLGIYVNKSNIFITDANTSRVQIFDLDGNFISKFGSVGTGNGQFQQPSGITGNSTYLFVGDTTRDDVQIFDLIGSFVTILDSGFKPGGLSSSDTNVYVIDQTNKRVFVYNQSGNYISTFGSLGSGDGQFQLISGIGVNENEIFIGDQTKDVVQIFDLDGNFISKFGSSGAGDGQFQNIRGIGANYKLICVSDGTNLKFQIFK